MSKAKTRRRGRHLYKSRVTQIAELASDALFKRVSDPDDPQASEAVLELFVKERPKGEGYVCDFVYSDPSLPITACGVLLQSLTGLMVGELELFRAQWGYFNDYGEFVGPHGQWRAKGDETWDVSAAPDGGHPPFSGITGALLRTVPIGRIIAWAHEAMADDEWREEGLVTVGIDGPTSVPAAELPSGVKAALERTAAVPTQRRGRPPIPGDLLEEVAIAYLDEAKRGRGLTRRLALRFDRPEETVRDWIRACRVRGYLSPAVAGRRGAQPGELLLKARSSREEEN